MGTNKTIEITVTAAGEAKVETTGFAGPACRAASRFVEAALGRVTSARVTAEFHAATPAEARRREYG